MVKKKSITPEELALFHEAMKGTTPLSHNKNRIAKPKPLTVPVTKTSKLEEVFSQLIEEDLPAVRGEEVISFKQPGITDKILRKMRKGQYNVEAILDLHGMTVEEARAEVEEFLQQCLRRKLKVVLVIHGKGKHSEAPVLKNKLNNWLRTAKPVLAFCSAAATHGNRGALYILLRRHTEENLFE